MECMSHETLRCGSSGQMPCPLPLIVVKRERKRLARIMQVHCPDWIRNDELWRATQLEHVVQTTFLRKRGCIGHTLRKCNDIAKSHLTGNRAEHTENWTTKTYLETLCDERGRCGRHHLGRSHAYRTERDNAIILLWKDGHQNTIEFTRWELDYVQILPT